MFRVALFVVACAAFVESSAQGLYGRKRKDIIPLDGQAKRIGLFIGPGLSYTLPPFAESEREQFRSGDTL